MAHRGDSGSLEITRTAPVLGTVFMTSPLVGGADADDDLVARWYVGWT
jgi:hypothetical protein